MENYTTTTENIMRLYQAFFMFDLSSYFSRLDDITSFSEYLSISANKK